MTVPRDPTRRDSRHSLSPSSIHHAYRRESGSTSVAWPARSPLTLTQYTVTMFIIDVAPSMGKMRPLEITDPQSGESEVVEMTNLQWSLQFVMLKIQEMVGH